MPPVAVPTGSDLAAYMGRSDPGYFDDLVAEWVDHLGDVAEVDPWTYAHTRAVLAQAAADVESVGYKGGVILSDFGPVYARRKTVQLETILPKWTCGNWIENSGFCAIRTQSSGCDGWLPWFLPNRD